MQEANEMFKVLDEKLLSCLYVMSVLQPDEICSYSRARRTLERADSLHEAFGQMDMLGASRLEKLNETAAKFTASRAQVGVAPRCNLRTGDSAHLSYALRDVPWRRSCKHWCAWATCWKCMQLRMLPVLHSCSLGFAGAHRHLSRSQVASACSCNIQDTLGALCRTGDTLGLCRFCLLPYIQLCSASSEAKASGENDSLVPAGHLF